MKYSFIYKLSLISFLFLLSIKASAFSCEALAKLAKEEGGVSATKYSYTVTGNKGFRTYFHSAPTDQCKIKNLFIIPKDSVIAYQYIKNENKDWMYIMYLDKNGNYPTGWVLKKDFKETGTMNTPL